MKDVKQLMPDSVTLDYMSKQDRAVSKHLAPMRDSLASDSARLSQALTSLAQGLSQYSEDVKMMHQLCEVVSRLPKERAERNTARINADMLFAVQKTNPTEAALLTGKTEFEQALSKVRQTVFEVCLSLKMVQIDTAESDLEHLMRADGCLRKVLERIAAACKTAVEKIEDSVHLLTVKGHKQCIQEEYARLDPQQHLCFYSPNWKPFHPDIKELEQDPALDHAKMKRLSKSFEHLFKAIEASFETQHVERTYIPFLNALSKMQQLLLAKSHELEYASTNPNDCAFPLTRHYIEFYQSLYSHIADVIEESYFKSKQYEILASVLKTRANYFSALQQTFAEVKRRYTDCDPKSYFVPEYWNSLSSLLYDFMERIYTNNSHQKRDLAEAAQGLLESLGSKALLLSKEIVRFYQTPKQPLLASDGYQRLLVENYNNFIKDLKQQYAQIKIEEGYQLEFIQETLKVRVNPKLLQEENGSAALRGILMGRPSVASTLQTRPGVSPQTPNPKPLEFSLGVKVPPPPLAKDSPWKIDRSAFATQKPLGQRGPVPPSPAEVASKLLREEIERKYKKSGKSEYSWVAAKSFKLQGLSMDDYLNLMVRKRVIKCDGEFFPDFNLMMMHKKKEVMLKSEPLDPPVESGICAAGYGRSSSLTVKEVPMKLKIPFFPPTFQANFKQEIFLLNPSHLFIFGRTDSKGIPGSEAFHVLNCLEVREVAEPRHIVTECSSCLVFTGSTIVEGTIRDNVPVEVAESFNNAEECMQKVIKENQPDVAEKDPNAKVETNNPYDLKLMHSAQFKNLASKPDQIFHPHRQAPQPSDPAKPKQHRYLGVYDKSAEYLARPESSNPDFEDIFNLRQASSAGGKADQALNYIGMIKDKNLGLVAELTEKQKIIYSQVTKDPTKFLKDVREQLHDRRVLSAIGLVFFLLILKLLE